MVDKVGSLPGSRIPYPDIGVQAACNHSLAVKGNGVDLTKMPLQCLQAAAFRYAPDTGECVVAAGNDNVAFDLETSHARLMADEYISTHARPYVPDPERRIARTRNGGVLICHFQTSDGRCVTSQGVKTRATTYQHLPKGKDKGVEDFKSFGTYAVLRSHTLTSRSQPPLTRVSSHGTIAQTPITWPCSVR